ncbi:GspH/FimT family pseudopilin [Marinimicrobium alkaliphilum]|uniref:GspH/FimT family pseudopilin n=1 Tax=Marinimicrobium alkaliphilum TaxID=2202654 RepID=UPI000DB9FCBF|nr:GspH/FimT family pseudopilin [Marinimicrobium alkaliphilum]
MRQRGITLYELVISLAVLAILMGAGLPAMTQQLHNTQSRAAAFELRQALQQARTLAVSRNQRVTLRAQEDWHQGWLLFVDTANSGKPDDSDEWVSRTDALSGVVIRGNHWVEDYVSFIGTGEARRAHGGGGGMLQMGTFEICPSAGGEGYRLVLARGGRVRMQRIGGEDCAPA